MVTVVNMLTVKKSVRINLLALTAFSVQHSISKSEETRRAFQNLKKGRHSGEKNDLKSYNSSV